MTDLYAMLGLEPSATTEQIRGAYRAKSKTLHPDVGGGREEWEALSLAHDVLSDPLRRAEYDRTGATAEIHTDTLVAQLLTQTFNSVVLDLLKQDRTPKQHDLRRLMLDHLKGQIDTLEEKIADFADQIEEMEELAPRFTAEETRDGRGSLMRRLIEAQAVMVSEKMAKPRLDLDVAKAAQDEINKHSFLVEPMPKPAYPQSFGWQPMQQASMQGPVYPPPFDAVFGRGGR